MGDEASGCWYGSVADLIETTPLSKGDRVEIEYINVNKNLDRKTATVETVHDHPFRSSLFVDVDGAMNEWTIGNSISIEYEYPGRRPQHRHLGSVERVRKLASKPTAAADPRPGGVPYYIDESCPECGGDLIPFDDLDPLDHWDAPALGRPPVSDVVWHDEFVCPDCLDGLHMDWPESYSETLFERMESGDFVSLDAVDDRSDNSMVIHEDAFEPLGVVDVECPECGHTIDASAVTVGEIYCERCDEVFDCGGSE